MPVPGAALRRSCRAGGGGGTPACEPPWPTRNAAGVGLPLVAAGPHRPTQGPPLRGSSPEAAGGPSSAPPRGQAHTPTSTVWQDLNVPLGQQLHIQHQVQYGVGLRERATPPVHPIPPAGKAHLQKHKDEWGGSCWSGPPPLRARLPTAVAIFLFPSSWGARTKENCRCTEDAL